MKPPRTLSILSTALFVFATAAVPAAPGTNAAWEKMKSLAGEWNGTMSHEGQEMPVSVSYTLV